MGISLPSEVAPLMDAKTANGSSGHLKPQLISQTSESSHDSIKELSNVAEGGILKNDDWFAHETSKADARSWVSLTSRKKIL